MGTQSLTGKFVAMPHFLLQVYSILIGSCETYVDSTDHLNKLKKLIPTVCFLYKWDKTHMHTMLPLHKLHLPTLLYQLHLPPPHL